MFLNWRQAENALALQEAGHPVLEIVAHEGESPLVEGPRLFVPLQGTDLSGEIVWPLATLTLTQRFLFSSSNCPHAIEAAYRFPLPGDAAVAGCEISFGETSIRADLKEREAAEAEYEEAKARGKQAALVTRESPDVFTLQVNGIRPDEDVVVQTTFCVVATAHGIGWSLRVPLTTAPRYVREDDAQTRHAQGQPLAVLRDPGHCFSISSLTVKGATVTSPSHQIITQESPSGDFLISLDKVLPDQDLILTGTPHQKNTAPSLQVFHHESGDGHTYFLAQITPPATPANIVPREALLVVDQSGSMRGDKWTAAVAAAKQLLLSLQPQDTFGLCLFNSLTQWWNYDTLLPATPENIERASEFLDSQRANAGTDIGSALEQALAFTRQAGPVARDVLIISDAAVTDYAMLLRVVENEAGRPLDQRRRISILCIDSAPNTLVIHQIVHRSGGIARFLQSSPGHGDISAALVSILDAWEPPVAANLLVQVSRKGVQATEHEVTSQGISIGDLTAKQSRWVIGRFPSKKGRLPRFDVVSAEETIATASPTKRNSKVGPGVRALFGAWRLMWLEMLMHSRRSGEALQGELGRLGYGPAALAQDSVYAENIYAFTAEALQPLLVRESLAYGVACSETAFIAVREDGEPVDVVGPTVAVANALPDGWSAGFATPQLRLRPHRPSEALSPPGPTSRLLRYDKSGQEDPFATPKRPATLSFPSRASASKSEPSSSFLPPRFGHAEHVVFQGAPLFKGDEATLFFSRITPLDSVGYITTLKVETGDLRAISKSIELRLFVGDVAIPKEKISLATIIAQGGVLSLTLSRQKGESILITLLDPNKAAGNKSTSAPFQITVTLTFTTVTLTSY